MPLPREKLRLQDADRKELVESVRTCHVATTDDDGTPHVVPLWFVIADETLFVNSLRRSKRGRHLAAGSAVAVCIDAGIEYQELRGLVATGRFAQVTDEAILAKVREVFGNKYWKGIKVPEVKSHDWFALVPEKEVSWDFRRIAEAGSDPRSEALDKKS